MLQPRPYQTEALNAVLKNYKDGVNRQLVNLPTGCGKTIIFGLVAEAMKTRTLVLAHREELLAQTQQKIKLVYPDADTGILQASERGGLGTDICIASVQTATRCTDELAERGFNLLICDEAHHAVSNSYMRIFRDLGFMSDNPEKLLLGVTATAFRGDNAALGAVFSDIVFERSIAAMITGGYLCPPRGLQIGTDVNISNVSVQHGDFNAGQLENLINTDTRNKLIVNSYLEYGENRHGIAFTVSVEHAMDLASAFQEKNITCEAVYGDMPKDERQDVLRRYENHELQLLTNVGVLTEGWDVPDTDIVLMARPTKSKTLYIQCIGRGLRLAPGKQDCLIMDFADVTRRHDICSFGTLFGKELPKKNKEPEEEEKEDGYEETEQDTSERGQSGLFKTPKTQEIELFQRSKFVWEAIQNNYRLHLLDGSSLICEVISGGYTPVFISNTGKMEKLSDEVLPLGYAMGVCEDYARRFHVSSYSQKDAAWRNEPATEKQIAALKRNNVDFRERISKGEAAELLNAKMSEPATNKQIWLILKEHLHPAPQFLTKYEAAKIIREYKEQE